MNGTKRHRRSSQRLDPDTAERMFAGLAAADAPPNYAVVAAVLAAASAPVTALPAPGEAAALRAFRDVKYVGAPLRADRWFTPWRTMAGRFAVVATAGTLAISGGVAAAATGTAPVRPHHATHQVAQDPATVAAQSTTTRAGVFYSRAAAPALTVPTPTHAKAAARPAIGVIPAGAVTPSTARAASNPASHTATTPATTTTGPTTSKDAPQGTSSPAVKPADGQQNGHGNGNAQGPKNGNNGHGNGNGRGNDQGNNGNGHGNSDHSSNGHGNNGNGHGATKDEQQNGNSNGRSQGRQNGKNGNAKKGDNGNGRGNAKNGNNGNGHGSSNPGKGHQQNGNSQH